jgi:hypothetical protein
MSWPSNPVNGQQILINGVLYQYNLSNDTWDKVGGSSNNLLADFVQTPTLIVTEKSHLGNAANVEITGGTAGFVLQTDGTGNLAWAAQAMTSPGGNLGTVQFHDGVLQGSDSFTFNKTTNTLSVTNIQGNITTGVQTNITRVGTLANLAVTANITAGNVAAQTFTGNLVGNVTGNLSAPGSTTQVLFNNQGNIGASANITFNGTVLNVASNINTANLTATSVVATTLSGSLTTSNQPNVTRLGTLANLRSSGNINAPNFVGNLVGGNVSGNFISPGSNTQLLFNNEGVISAASNLTYNGSILTITGNVNSDNANLGNLASANYIEGILTTASQPNITSLGTLIDLTASGNITTSANVVAGNYVGNVSGGVISGTFTSPGSNTQVLFNRQGVIRGASNLTFDGSSLSVTGSATVSGTINAGNVSAANLTGTLTTSSQPNVTRLGNLTSANVTGNLIAGNIAANYNINGATITGVLTTGGQPNITSVGTLSSLTVSGDLNASNVIGNLVGNRVNANYYTPPVTSANTQILTNQSGNVIGSSNLTFNGTLLNVASNINTANLTATSVVATTLSGSLTTGSQPNITSVGTLTNINTSGNITATGNVSAYKFTGNLYGNVIGTLTAPGSDQQVMYNENGNIAGNPKITFNPTGVATLTVSGNIVSNNANLGNRVTANYISGSLLTNSQPNINQVGTLQSLSIDGNISISNSTITIDNNTLIKGNLIPDGTLEHDLGSPNHRWKDLYLSGNTIKLGRTSITTTAGGSLSTGTTDLQSSTVISTATGVAPFLVASNIMVANLNVELLQGYTPNSANLPNTIPLRDQLNNFEANVITANLAGWASTAGKVTDASQPNITSLGLLTSLDVRNTLTANNVRITGPLSATTISGNGLALYTINGANVVNEVPYANWARNADDALRTVTAQSATNVINVTGSSQPNIRSLGTLTKLDVTGTITGGNLAINYDVVAANFYGNVIGGSVSGVIQSPGANTQMIFNNGGVLGASGGARFNYLTNALTITGKFNSVDANLGNLVEANYFKGSGNNLSNIRGSNVQGEVAFAGVANSVSGANISGQVTNAVVAGTVYTAAQPNITSVGTLTDLNINSGLLSTSNPVDIVQTWSCSSVAFTAIKGLITDTASNTNSLLLDLQIDGQSMFKVNKAGNVNLNSLTGTNAEITVTKSSQPYITTLGTLDALTVRGNITSGNANLGNAVNANYFVGNGSLLTGLPASYTNTNVATFLPTFTGNIQAGNANLGNTVTANYFVGSGNSLSNIQGANVVGAVPSATTATTATSAGTVTNPSQSAITSVGTLTSLTTGSTVNPSLGNNVTATYFTGTLTTAAQPNITSVSRLVSLTVGNAAANTRFGNGTITAAGNIDAANITGNLYGNGSGINYLQGGVIVGDVPNANYSTYALNVTGPSQPNITSLNTTAGLVSLKVAGDTTLKDVTVSGNLTVSGTTISANATTLNVKDPIIEQGGNIGGALISNDGKDRGQLLHYFNGGAVDAFMGWNTTYGEFRFGSNVTVSAEVVTIRSYGNVRAGNFIGSFNGDGSNISNVSGISNGSSNVNIIGTDGIINVAVNGSDVVMVTGTGVNVAGTLNIGTGNANVGNLGISGLIGVTGNITGGNISSNGALTAKGTITGSSIIGAIAAGANNITTTGTITGTSIVGAIAAGANNITTSGTITGGTIIGIIAAGANAISTSSTITGSSIIGAIAAGANNITTSGTITGGNVSTGGTVTATGTITGGNLITGGLITATSSISTGSTVTATGTITGGNIATGGTVTATGNIATGGKVDATGTITGGNIATGGTITATSSIATGSSITATGTITGGNIATGGRIDATGTIATSSSITATGSISTDSTVTATGTITGGNIATGGTITGGTITGRIAAGANNITTTGTVTGSSIIGAIAAGANNITTTGIASVGNLNVVTAVVAGTLTSNIATGAPLTVTSTTRVANLNVNYANVSDYGVVTTQTTGTFYPVFVSSNTNGNYAHASNANLSFNAANGALSATTFIGTHANGNSNVNIPSANANISLSVNNKPNIIVVTGDGANISGALNVTGDIQTTTGYFIGDGSKLTGIAATSFAGGTSNVSIPSPDGNINLSINNIPNVVVVTSSGINVNGTITGTILTSNIASGTAPLKVTSTTRVANLNVDRASISDYSYVVTQTTGTFYPVFVNNSSTANYQKSVSSGFSFNAANNALFATTFSGLLSGNVVDTVANSKITVGSSINMSVSNQPNILTITSSGVNVAGTLNTGTGNANVGNLGVTNDLIVSGSLTVSGTTTTVNSTTTRIIDPIIELGGGLNGIALTTNDTKDRGTLLHYYVGATGLGTATDAFMGWKNSSNEFIFGSTVTENPSGNIQVTTYGNVHVGNIIGNGQALTGINGANVVSQVANALVASTVYGAAQGSITSLGTLTGLTVNGDASVGNLTATTTVSANTLKSTIATGNAPLTVTSTTRVSNLNVAYAGVSDYSVVTTQATGTSPYYPMFVSGSSAANYQPGVNSSLSFVPGTGVLTATSFAGSSLTNGTPVGNISINSGGNVSISAAGTAGVVSVTGSSVTISKDLSVSNLTVNGMATFYQSTDVMVSPVYTGTTVYTHDYTTGGVIYLSGLTGAVTINLTNIPTSVNRTIVVPVIIAQGATGYVPSLQIVGVAQTIKWLGGTTPTATASKTEVFGFTLIRTTTGTWVVLGQLASYG